MCTAVLRKGDVSQNTVTMSNSSLSIDGTQRAVYGGYTADGNAEGNEVSIDNKSYVSDAYGGHTGNGDASGNAVSVKNTSIPDASGGVAAGKGSASSNTVTLENSMINSVAGGSANEGDATGNTVTLINSDATMVYGGSANTGNASGNIVTMTGGTGNGILFVVGGIVNGSGDALDNQVTITNLTKDTQFMSGMPVIAGGVTMDGKTARNTLSLTQNNGTVINMADDQASMYGGYASEGASGNSLSVSGSDLTAYDLYGGFTVSGDAVSNSVSVNGSTVTGNTYGGYPASGNTSKNTVLLTNAGVEKDTSTEDAESPAVYGGFSESGDASENTVTVDGGTTSASLYGGYTKEGGCLREYGQYPERHHRRK